MKIPNFHDFQFVDKRGYLTTEWRAILGELFTQLQLNVSDEGFVIPQLTTSEIAQLVPDERYIGSFIYNSDTNEMNVNIAGTYKVLTAT